MPRPNLIDQPATPSETNAFPPFESKAEALRYIHAKGGRAGRDIAERLGLTNCSIWPDAAERFEG